ncbi:MAG: hypothetical protein JKY85_01580 [Porticoccus sp.]|nr:hypothetical protein [Porticoccus sp.]
MENDNPSFVERLRQGWQKAKKPMAFLIMIFAAVLSSPLQALLPESISEYALAGTILALSLILVEMIFQIYEEVLKDDAKLNIISSNELYGKISNIIRNEKSISIQFIGVAGRNGWQNVIEKFMMEKSSDSIINKIKFNIEMALLDPNECDRQIDIFERFDMVSSVVKQIERKSNHIKEISVDGSNLSLYLYDYMPNMLGLLINENYLFLTNCYWEEEAGKLHLRAGGTDYFAYSKGDDFGGQENIARFKGWFSYIKHNHNKTHENLNITSNENA